MGLEIDVGEKRRLRIRREQQMEEIRMRMLEMQYRMWYSKGLEKSSQTFSLDSSDSYVEMQSADFASMLGEVSDEIWSEDVNLQMHATTQIEKLLSVERECATTLIKNGVARRIVHFLIRDDFLELQYEAAWALIKIACGTCGKPKTEFVREAVPCFVRLLDSPSDDVCGMALFALGIVARDSCKYRDLVLRNGVLVPLLKQLEKHANMGKHAKLSMQRNVTWTLSIFCKDISERCYKKVKSALTTLGHLLDSDDVEVLIHSCWAIHGLSFDVCFGKIDALMDAGLCPKLVKHLLHSSHRVQIPVLLTVALIPFERIHIQALIEKGALGHLLTLLTEDPEDRIKEQACRVISGILDAKECQIQAVIDAKLFGPLVKLLESPDEDLQEEAAQAISNATSRGSRKQIEYLVYECKMINPLCNLLYSPNAKTVELGLQVVNNVLTAGTSKQNVGSSDVCPTPNPYAKLIFEAQAVEKIEEIKCHAQNETCITAAAIILHLLGLNDDLFLIDNDDLCLIKNFFQAKGS